MTKNSPEREKTAYHHGDLKKALITAALAIVEEEGVDGLSLRKAARRVGVSHAAPTHHFRDMSGLLAAVATQGFRELFQAMKTSVGRLSRKEPLAVFKAIGMAYIEFAAHHTAYFRVMFHMALAEKSRYPKLREASQETFELMVKAVSGCQQAGLIMEGEPRELALSAWAAVHGLATLIVNGQLTEKGLTDSPEELADMITRMLYMGLARK